MKHCHIELKIRTEEGFKEITVDVAEEIVKDRERLLEEVLTPMATVMAQEFAKGTDGG